MEKDPYLSELDEIHTEVADDRDVYPDEATRVDQPFPPEETITNMEAPQNTIMSGLEANPQSSSIAKDILNLAPDLPVQMIAVMGSKAVSVKDLLELRLGQVVDWNKLPTDPIDLVVNGRVIARGELVDIDGKLGVKVLKVLK